MSAAAERAFRLAVVALFAGGVWLAPGELAALLLVNAATWLAGYPATRRYLRAAFGEVVA